MTANGYRLGSHPDILTRALENAVASLEAVGPHAIALGRCPDDDCSGCPDTGWVIAYTAGPGQPRKIIHRPEWARFPPVSSAAALMEHGWNVHPSAFSVRTRRAGWARHFYADTGETWTAPIVSMPTELTEKPTT